jgi:hypothetical protein
LRATNFFNEIKHLSLILHPVRFRFVIKIKHLAVLVNVKLELSARRTACCAVFDFTQYANMQRLRFSSAGGAQRVEASLPSPRKA